MGKKAAIANVKQNNIGNAEFPVVNCTDRLSLVFTWQHQTTINQPNCGKVVGKIAKRNFLTCYFIVIAIGSQDCKNIILHSF